MSGSRDTEYTEYVTARLSSLRRLAAVLCGGDWQRADDLVQSTLAKLYVHWGRVRAADHADAYARSVLVRPAAPAQVDLPAALRRGRSRLRWRRAGLAAACALVMAVVATLVVVVPGRAPLRPVPAVPAAPRQFSPLVTNVSFGWLPAGMSLGQGLVKPTVVLQAAGRPPGFIEFVAEAYTRGQCHFTGSVSGLKCGGKNGSSLPFDAPAPAINGHRAFWSGANLVWEYARGGWAWLSIAVHDYATLKRQPVLLHQSLRIAANLRIGGASAHLAFPVQFTGLTGHWRIAELHYFAADGALQAQEFTLISDASRFLPHVGDLGVWANAAYVLGHPATSSGTCSADDPSPVWSCCSGTTCTCSAATRRTGLRTPSAERPDVTAGS